MKLIVILISGLFAVATCGQPNQSNNSSKTTTDTELDQERKQLLKEKDVAYLASGCFWCVEEVFESVIGVGEVVSGYAGGTASDATYEKVSAGRTRHAEAVEIFYDKDQITYEQLLEVFFASQDPTTKDQQGPDRGPQYRSAIFYQSESEKKTAEAYIQKLTDDKTFKDPIVTEVVPFEKFYAAEAYHQDYVARNPNNGYVRGVSQPRYERFKAKKPELLKK